METNVVAVYFSILTLYTFT